MKQSKKVKDMSIYEASDFWDEHDFGEFDDVKEIKGMRFAAKKRKYIAIDFKLYSKIRDKARKLHTTEDALIDDWLKKHVAV